VAGKLERLARVTRSESSPNDQTLDLSSLARDIAAQLADMADVRGVSIEIDEALPPLTADAGRVELVLMNLLANAVKYSDPDRARSVVRVRADWQDGLPRVCVEDNGLGIPAGKLAVIFEQFERAHAHLDEELGAQGLGLGLSIVRECMDAMGGAVTVESREREGATFILTWPAEAWRSA
jgi:signal transduction histidine kinase